MVKDSQIFLDIVYLDVILPHFDFWLEKKNYVSILPSLSGLEIMKNI